VERPTKVADCAASNTQAEQKLLASELGTQILALRDEKEKAIRRESGGVVPWIRRQIWVP
jgi:hypothetical protein